MKYFSNNKDSRLLNLIQVLRFAVGHFVVERFIVVIVRRVERVGSVGSVGRVRSVVY